MAAALADCKADFAEGAVGAGRGMRCHGLKGGIGSASRLVELDGKSYTIGAMVLSNHATFDDLIVAGTPIHELLEARIPPHEDKGSIITVLATDIPPERAPAAAALPPGAGGAFPHRQCLRQRFG